MDKTINIAICDDDINTAKKIEELIKSVDSLEPFNTTIFVDGKKFCDTNLTKYDIVFLDIELGDMSGIDIAVELKKVNTTDIVFFITSYTSYISDAFKTMPFQYLLKPINEKLFREEFLRGLEKLKKAKYRIKIITKYGESNIKVDSIAHIEYINKKLIFYTRDEKISVAGKLSDWTDKLLSYDFVQCHKSFLVNLNCIKTVKYNQIVMDDNTIIPIGRKYAKSFIEGRNNFLLGKNI